MFCGLISKLTAAQPLSEVVWSRFSGLLEEVCIVECFEAFARILQQLIHRKHSRQYSRHTVPTAALVHCSLVFSYTAHWCSCTLLTAHCCSHTLPTLAHCSLLHTTHCSLLLSYTAHCCSHHCSLLLSYTAHSHTLPTLAHCSLLHIAHCSLLHLESHSRTEGSEGLPILLTNGAAAQSTVIEQVE